MRKHRNASAPDVSHYCVSAAAISITWRMVDVLCGFSDFTKTCVALAVLVIETCNFIHLELTLMSSYV